MNFEKKLNFVAFFFILIIFGVDRYTKIFVKKNFTENVIYVNDFLNFDLIWNTGIGFGLMNTNSEIFYNSVSLLIGLIIIWLIFLGFKSDNYDKIIFSIIIGGALGNFYDRIFFKAVPDFIDVHFENFHWFTFNVADIFITLGIIFYLIKDLFIKKEKL